MKNIKLYEEYIIEALSNAGTTNRVLPLPPNVREVVLYSDREQRREKKRGWINFDEWEKNIKNVKPSGDILTVPARLFSNQVAAEKLQGGEKFTWLFFTHKNPKLKQDQFDHFYTGDSMNLSTLYYATGRLFNSKFSEALQRRLLQQNQAGVWIVKVSKYGFADNSSVDIPDKFA